MPNDLDTDMDYIAETAKDVTEANQTPATPAKAPRVKSNIDATNGLLTYDGTTISVASIPDATLNHLALAKVRDMLNQSDDVIATIARILAGNLSARGPAKPKEMDPWRRAIANVLVKETAKSDDPWSAERALDYAESLDRSGLIKAKQRGAVAAEHDKLMNAHKIGLIDWLAPAETARAD